MKKLKVAKETFMRHEDGRTPMANFILYVDGDRPELLMRIYQSIGNDVWDEQFDIISNDNGRTWSKPKVVLKREPAEGGEMTYTEGAALYCAEHRLLVTLTNYGFAPSRISHSFDSVYKIHVAVGDPQHMESADAFVTDFGLVRQNLVVSFCHPLIDSTGRLIFPAMNAVVDTPKMNLRERYRARAGEPDVMADYWEPRIILGTFKNQGAIDWHVSAAVPFDTEKTARGLCEPTVTELLDGTFAMVSRGSSAVFIEGKGHVVKTEHPGVKWVSYSYDRGQSWTKAVPLTDEYGKYLESSATGSFLFRSIVNGKLYWLGNLCTESQKAIGNWPRDHLMLAELSESGCIAVKRETIALVAAPASGETDQVQHSNFRAYQDRETGELVLLMNRFFERGGYENMAWHNTDLYRYRIRIG